MRTTNGLTDVFAEWQDAAPVREIDAYQADQEMISCLDLYNVRYIESFLSDQGDRMICHFTAPDAESVRQALRGAGLKADAIWAGSICSEPDADTGNVIMEILHEPGFDAEKQKRRNNSVTRALHLMGVRRSRAFQSLDGLRGISLLAVPDHDAAHQTRSTLQQLSDAVWCCEHRT